MHNLLAIETSSEACSVALSFNGETRHRHHHAPLQHAELLLPAVRSLLAEAGTTLACLDAIAFGRGPGSFTSLRIGIGVVQGLAWAAEIPVVPVSSLASVAQQTIACESGNGSDLYPRYVLVAMDARMGEVFHCVYEVSKEGVLLQQSPELVTPPSAVSVTRSASTLGAGNGFERYAELTQLGRSMSGVYPEFLPSAMALIPLAEQWLQQHEPLPAAQAQPVYIRNHVADKPSPPG